MLGQGSTFRLPILSVPGWMILVFKVITGAFSVTYPVSNKEIINVKTHKGYHFYNEKLSLKTYLHYLNK